MRTLSASPGSFGDLLREFRHRAGLSQEELEERAKVAKDTISALERGKRRYPTLETVKRLAAALGLAPVECERFETAARRPVLPRRRARKAVMPDPDPGAARLTNLSREPRGIIGRLEELTAVRGLLREHRLVTLVGSGGVGKTRLAREAGTSLLGDFPDGVWYVELAVLVDAPLIVECVAAALEMPTSAEVPTLQALMSFVRHRRLLLIVDNCEHVIAGAASLVDSLLGASDAIRVLATSRERLRIPAEATYRVPPLPFPKTEDNGSLAEIQEFAAVELFARQAKAVASDFELSRDTAPAVASICRRLDGIPLALELAASRVETLGVVHLLDLLDQRFLELAGGARTALPRHQTMYALIEWSFELLEPRERLALERLACFPGHWSLDAASAVCGFGPLEPGGVLEAVLSLVDKSLVVRESSSNRLRYRLLESTRQFALAKLAGRGEREAVERRMAEWVAEFSDRAAADVHTTPRATLLPALFEELGNARAALSWSLGGADEFALAARIIAGFGTCWVEQGLVSEGSYWALRALRGLEGKERRETEASLWQMLSNFITGSRSAEAAREAITRFEELGDIVGLRRAHMRLSFALQQMGRFEESEDAIDRALTLFRQAGLTRSLVYASALGWRALALLGLGRRDEARDGFVECIALHEALGDRDRAAIERLNLAEVELADGRVAEALGLIHATLDVLRGPNTAAAQTVALLNSAACRIVLGDLDAARVAAEGALRLTRRLGPPLWEAVAVGHLATVASLAGDVSRAARLAGYVERRYAEEGAAREPTERRIHEILEGVLRARLSAEERAALEAAGRRLAPDAAHALATSVDRQPT